MKKNSNSVVRRFINSVVNRRQGAKSKLGAPRSRLLRLEGLESRELLDASPIASLATVGEIACVATLDPEVPEPIELSNAVASTTWRVTSTADTDTSGTLRYAVNHAASGDTITFADSLKGKTITLGGTQLEITKSITIDASSIWNSSTQKPGITINANAKSRVFNVAGAGDVTFNGLEITNGTGGYGFGGGVYIDKNSTGSFNDCFITNNRESGVFSYGNNYYTNCTISGNTSSYDGGGVAIKRSGMTSVIGSFTNCIITNNNAGSSGDGGGIYFQQYNTGTFVSCTITRNTAHSGGGIYGVGDFTNCIISLNTAKYAGGGVHQNIGTSTYTNCVISDNNAGSYGGGVYSGNTNITNCTIAGNIVSDANSEGGGIYHHTGTVTFYNSIVTLNSAANGNDLYKESYSTVTACNTLSSYSNWSTGANVVNYEYDSSKPLFTDATNGVYTLATSSQAINKGANRYVTETTDLARNARIADGTVDLGAYEYCLQPLSTPTLSVTSSTSSSISVSWSGIQNASGYTLQYKTSNTSTWTTVSTISSSLRSYTLSGLVAATSYDMRLLAKGSGVYSDSDYSAVVSYNTKSQQLSTPTLYAVDSDQDSISVKWNAIANASGYTLQYKESSASSWTSAPALNASQTSYTVSGLTAGTTYHFRLLAKGVGAYSDSNYSGTISYSTTTRQLSTPTLSRSSATLNSITVTWNAIANASGYTLQYKKASESTWQTEPMIASESTSHTVSGLAGGTTYNFRMFANGSGTYIDSELSAVVSYSTTTQPLSTPTFSDVSSTYNSITVSWNSVSNASGYVVQYRKTNDSTWLTTATLSPSLTSYTLDGLDVRTPYIVRMYAKGTGAYLDSSYSDAITCSTLSQQLATPNLTVSNSTQTSITVAWDAIANASGYTLQYKKSTGSIWWTAPTIAASQTNYTLTDLAAGTSYNIRLLAKGSGVYTDSNYCAVVTYATKTKQLAVPTLTAFDSTQTSITVTWNAITNATGYTMQFKKSNATTWTTLPTIAASQTSYTIDDLDVNTTYNLRMLAKGSGSYSSSDYSAAISCSTKPQAVAETPSTIVTTLRDVVDETDNLISLREAIEYASDESNYITFDASLAGQTITVNSELFIDKSVWIDGESHNITLSGGGASRVIRVASYVLLENLTIANGYDVRGAGVYIGGGWCDVRKCSFINNTATTAGGGIYVAGAASLYADNLLIANNSAPYGGGVYSYGGADKEVLFWNCTIAGNKATTSGSGLHLETANGIVQIYNTIIAQNTGKSDVQKKSSARNIVAENTLSTYTAWSSGESNYVYDSSRPLFADSSVGDYTLAPDSQAIDLSHAIFSDTDLVGNPRLSGTSVDLGAYEFQTQNEAPSTLVTTVQDVVDPTDGLISLREALAYAQSYDVVSFAPELSGRTITVSSELLVEKNVVIDGSNGITVSGGGATRVLRFLGAESDEYTILGLTITGGSHTHGAGVYVATGTANIINCSIVGNTSTTSGGGLYIAGKGEAKVVNTLIANNSAKYGGGVYSYGASGKSVALSNCTITANKATSNGSGLFTETGYGTVELRNSIIALNTVKSDVYKKTSSRSIKAYNTLSTFTGWSGGSSDNLAYNESLPLFVDVGNYTLTQGSQAINQGDNNYVETERDLANANRIVGAAVDLGAYEWQFARETPSTIVTATNDVVDPYDNVISLREAVAYAEPGDAVTFATSLYGQTITLSDELLIEKELSIDGESNRITLNGGGATRVLRFLGGEEDEYALRNLTITGGAHTHGAGVYVAVGAVNIVNCSIVGNKSTTSGGGIYVAGKGEATIVNTLVANNSAKYGGGIYSYGADGKSILIANSTIANNNATSSGSGLHLETAYGTLEIRNSIIALNTGKTDVYKKTSGRVLKAINTLSTYSAWSSGKNNLVYKSGSPLFTSVSVGDFTLAANSQALDKGSTASVLTATDLAGKTRIVGGKVDLGAYERQADQSKAILDLAFAELFDENFETF